MNRFTVSNLNGIFDGFADGGMRVYAIQDLMRRCFEFAGSDGLCDDLSYIVTNHVSTESLALFRIKYHLHKSFRMACSQSFT